MVAESGSRAFSEMDDLAGRSFDLVNRELNSTLDVARHEIEDYVDGHANKEALMRAAGMLHLACGALKIVEIHGAALLASEMEQTCHSLAQTDDEAEVERGVDALTRAMVQLPAYLDRLLSGGRDVALVLLPLLNDLRQARKKPPLSEGTLLLLNSGPLERAARAAAPPLTAEIGDEFRAVAHKNRPAFQTALLGWLRGEHPENHLDELIDASDRLAAAAVSDSIKHLWEAVGAVLAAVRAGDLEATVALKRLIGQADRQLKRLIDVGEAEVASAPPVDLLNNLLYYVARARSEDPRIVALRKRFRLDDIVPGDAQIERAREGLAGPSVRLMRTVAEAIKEDLDSVKDVLDIFVRTGAQDVQQLKSQLDMLKKIGDTLGVLGLDAACNRIQEGQQTLAGIIAGQAGDQPGVLEQIAAALLDVEDALDRELVRVAVPGAGDEEGGEAAGREGADDGTQYRHVAQAVMGECIVNLAKIKDAVIKLVDEPGNVRALDQVKPQLRGITAGLLMLNKTKAVNVVERIGTTIAVRLTPSERPLKPEHLERLADAIVSVEYYMETVSLGRTDPWYMLDNAERCLDLLDSLPLPQAAAVPAPAAEQPPAARRPERPAAPPSVMEVDEDRSNPELVEVFIEEAKEEIAAINRYLPVWLENQQDTEALIAVRRSFHTLKGSGRMVGAQLVGEFAWSVENLLNRLINQTLEPSEAMLGFISEAAAAIPVLIEQLESGIAPQIDVQLLMKRAEAFAEADPAAESLTSESLRAPALGEDARAAAAEPGMDPVLTEIFVKEMRGHLDVLRQFVASANAGASSHAVTEPLYRACHTLLGSARMANCRAAIALAEPLDERLGRYFETGEALDAGGVETLARTGDEMSKMADALESGEVPTVDADLLARLQRLQPAVPASADAVEEPPVADAASFDPEIAAIFAEEAAEILERADTVLQALGGGGEAGGVTELQRLLHTLKGGARMAGVEAIGNLSHSLESLLAAMAAGRVPAAPEALTVVQRCLDQLHQMRDSVDAGRPVDEQPELRRQIDRLAEGAGAAQPAPDAPQAEPPQVEPPQVEPPQVEPPQVEPPQGEAPQAEARQAEAPQVEARQAEAPQAEAPQPEAPQPEAPQPEAPQAEAPQAEAPQAEAPQPEAPVAGERPAAAAALLAPSPPSRSDAAMPGPPVGAERAETTRVDADLLDVLLNGAGEISIFQSRLNQQLTSIEFHLGELGQTVTRLREQLRSLEAETEAQILHKHQDDLTSDEGFDPLELDRYSTIQQLSRALAETANDVASINELLYGLTTETDTLLTQQARVTSELQDGLMQTRMVSFQRHVARLARIVRQAAAETNKTAQLVTEGVSSELDRQVAESILPALEHLLRNAVVHGIESSEARRQAGKPQMGTVSLKLRREGTEVLIDVFDDGAGLDLNAIRRKAQDQGLVAAGQSLSDDEAMELILRPGFSTAAELTKSAGRGVGMDVVDNEVKKLSGSMRIESTPGEGTHFLIRLPYTLAITHALIVDVGEETFALPLPTIEGITRVRREQLLEKLTEDEPKVEYGGLAYRIQHLGSLVGAAPSALPEEENAVPLVLVRAGEQSAALLTDSLEGSREIVVKTLGPHIQSVPGVAGATILGDGRIAVILDAGTLARAHPAGAAPADVPEPQDKQLTALVVDDSITMRRVTQRLLERRGVRVLTARDGLDAISVLQEQEVDIILLDIEMPRMDGYQFATHVRNDPRLKDVPIIMITSRSGEKHRAKAIEVGVDDYLSKPYQEGQLIGAMEALLGRSL